MVDLSQYQQTTTQPAQPVYNLFSNLLSTGQNVASQPFPQYTPSVAQQYSNYVPGLVAPLTPNQQQAYQNIASLQGYTQPYLNAASGLTGASAIPIQLQQFNPSSVGQYMSPYLSNVLNSAVQNINETNAQQQQQLLGNAISKGAFGGDRTGIAQAALARQQGLANNATIANLLNAGYGQALGEFNTQQQAQAQADLYNRQLAQTAGQQLANLGTAGQAAAIQQANAQAQAGAAQQQQQQANLSTAYQQFLNQQAYPYQQLNFLGGLGSGAAGAMGGTTTASIPQPSTLSQALGYATMLGSLGNLGNLGGLGSLLGGSNSGGAGLLGGIGSLIGSFGSGLGNVASGIGSGLGDIFSGIGGIFGFEEGGRVHSHGQPPHKAVGGSLISASPVASLAPDQLIPTYSGASGGYQPVQPKQTQNATQQLQSDLKNYVNAIKGASGSNSGSSNTQQSTNLGNFNYASPYYNASTNQVVNDGYVTGVNPNLYSSFNDVGPYMSDMQTNFAHGGVVGYADGGTPRGIFVNDPGLGANLNRITNLSDAYNNYQAISSDPRTSFAQKTQAYNTYLDALQGKFPDVQNYTSTGTPMQPVDTTSTGTTTIPKTSTDTTSTTSAGGAGAGGGTPSAGGGGEGGAGAGVGSGGTIADGSAPGTSSQSQASSTPGVSSLSSGAMTGIGGVVGGLLGGAIAGPVGGLVGGMLGRSVGIDALSSVLGAPSLAGYAPATGIPTPPERPADLEAAVSTTSKASPSQTAPAPSVDVAETEAQAPETTSTTSAAPASTSTTSAANAMGNTTTGGFGLSGVTGGVVGANVAGAMNSPSIEAAIESTQTSQASQNAQTAQAQDQAATNAANQSAANNAASSIGAQTGFGGGIMGGSFGAPGEIGFNNDVSGVGQVSGPAAPSATPDFGAAMAAAAAAMAAENQAAATGVSSAAQASDFGQGLGGLAGGGFGGPGFGGRDSSTADTTGTTGGNAGGPTGSGFSGRDSSTADTTGQTGGNTTAGDTQGGFGGRDSSTADASGTTGGNAGGQTGGGGFGGRDSSTADTTGETGGNTTAGESPGGPDAPGGGGDGDWRGGRIHKAAGGGFNYQTKVNIPTISESYGLPTLADLRNVYESQAGSGVANLAPGQEAVAAGDYFLQSANGGRIPHYDDGGSVPPQNGGEINMEAYKSYVRPRESSNNPNAQNPNSSAGGLYQMTDSTFNDLLAKRQAQDPSFRQYQMASGQNPGSKFDTNLQNTLMDDLTRNNAKILQANGIQPTMGNLYASHFLGSAGGTSFLKQMSERPNDPAYSMVSPDAVRANQQVFFNPDGSPRSAQEVYGYLNRPISGGQQQTTTGPVQQQRTMARAPYSVTETPTKEGLSGLLGIEMTPSQRLAMFQAGATLAGTPGKLGVGIAAAAKTYADTLRENQKLTTEQAKVEAENKYKLGELALKGVQTTGAGVFRTSYNPQTDQVEVERVEMPQEAGQRVTIGGNQPAGGTTQPGAPTAGTTPTTQAKKIDLSALGPVYQGQEGKLDAIQQLAKEDLNQTYHPETAAAMRKAYFENNQAAQQAGEAAYKSKNDLATVAKAITQLSGDDITSGGPGADVRLGMANALNYTFGLTGTKDAITEADVTSDQLLKKVANFSAQTQGQREAAYWIKNLAQSYPNGLNTKEANADLLATLYIGNQMDIDRANFYRQYGKLTNQHGISADQAFRTLHPASDYAKEKALLKAMLLNTNEEGGRRYNPVTLTLMSGNGDRLNQLSKENGGSSNFSRILGY